MGTNRPASALMACQPQAKLFNAIALVPLVVVFGRFERPRAAEGAPAPAWRYVLGAIVTVAGLALLTAQGVGGYGKFGLNVWGLALALAGIGLIATRIGV